MSSESPALPRWWDTSHPAERVAGDELGLLDRFEQTNTPAVFTGLADTSPLLEATPGFLATLSRANNPQVFLRSTPLDDPFVDSQTVTKGRFPWHQALQTIEHILKQGSDEEAYVPGVSLSSLPSLLEHMPLPRMLWSRRLEGAPSLFLGINSRGILHFHPRKNAFLVHLSGRKRMVLYPPGHSRAFQFASTLSLDFPRSRLNLHGSGFQPSDGLRRAHAWIADLHPGDGLFIPLHWLHVPSSSGVTLSATFWWSPPTRAWSVNTTSIASLVGISQMHARRILGKVRKLGSRNKDS